MQKIIISENNIFDVAGRIRKFFSRCHDSGMYDKQTIRIKRENDMKKIMPYDWNGATYYSCPSRNQRDNISTVIDLDKIVEGKDNEAISIHIKYPVNTDLNVGDAVYFDGYRIFTRKRGRLLDFRLKSGRIDNNILSNFVNAYIKCINPDYDEKSDRIC